MHKNATARSPCKDEISFLSVKVSSVLPQSAAAVFLQCIISIKRRRVLSKKKLFTDEWLDSKVCVELEGFNKDAGLGYKFYGFETS